MTPPSEVSPVVVGLDLSLTGTGVAVLNDAGINSVSTVRSKPLGDSILARHLRLTELTRRIMLLVPPGAAVAVETPAYNQTSGSHHDRSGLWWKVVDALLLAEHRVWEVSTTQVKKYATGRGNAGKMEVMAAAIKRYQGVEIANDNEADAIVLAAFLSRALDHPDEAHMPAINLTALDKFKVAG